MIKLWFECFITKMWQTICHWASS